MKRWKITFRCNQLSCNLWLILECTSFRNLDWVSVSYVCGFSWQVHRQPKWIIYFDVYILVFDFLYWKLLSEAMVAQTKWQRWFFILFVLSSFVLSSLFGQSYPSGWGKGKVIICGFPFSTRLNNNLGN